MVSALGAVALASAEARADPPYIERRFTLGAGELGVNVGLGLGLATSPEGGVSGTGAYFQVGYGITERIEVLAREGARFGTFGEYARAEQYGRLYTTDGAVTPGPGPVSNPDLVFLFRIIDVPWFELGAEAEAGFPAEPGTRFANTVGVLTTFHYAPWLRFDTGAFVTLAYYSPVQPGFTAPFELWFQTGKFPLWFGPLTAITVNYAGTLAVPFGVGAGYAVNKDIDIRAEWFVPQANAPPGASDTGFGVGVEVRHGFL